MKKTVGNYLLDTLLGSGSFGDVYLCSHKLTKKQYAMKIDRDVNNIKTIKYEATILKYLRKVPNVIKLIHYGVHDKKHYIVMEMHGLTLEEFLITKKNISFMEKINFCLQILEILKNIHQKGIIHRDIKPENLLVSIDNSQLTLIDFGLAKIYIDKNGLHKPYKKNDSLIGSLNFCSINSHELYELSRKDDLISLLYILLYLYHGKLPWDNLSSFNNQSKKELIKIKKDDLLLIDSNDFIYKKIIHILNYLYNLDYGIKPNYFLIELYINNLVENT